MRCTNKEWKKNKDNACLYPRHTHNDGYRKKIPKKNSKRKIPKKLFSKDKILNSKNEKIKT